MDVALFGRLAFVARQHLVAVAVGVKEHVVGGVGGRGGEGGHVDATRTRVRGWVVGSVGAEARGGSSDDRDVLSDDFHQVRHEHPRARRLVLVPVQHLDPHVSPGVRGGEPQHRLEFAIVGFQAGFVIAHVCLFYAIPRVVVRRRHEHADLCHELLGPIVASHHHDARDGLVAPQIHPEPGLRPVVSGPAPGAVEPRPRVPRPNGAVRPHVAVLSGCLGRIHDPLGGRRQPSEAARRQRRDLPIDVLHSVPTCLVPGHHRDAPLLGIPLRRDVHSECRLERASLGLIAGLVCHDVCHAWPIGQHPGTHGDGGVPRANLDPHVSPRHEAAESDFSALHGVAGEAGVKLAHVGLHFFAAFAAAARDKDLDLRDVLMRSIAAAANKHASHHLHFPEIHLHPFAGFELPRRPALAGVEPRLSVAADRGLFVVPHGGVRSNLLIRV
mmetsp:Transcript_17329/g.42678  ORF Transcript_17329/g.42678 Transcript_17329/m.42678 type:complete len:441 (+) Transcript_17329:213-1535(+)